MALTSIGAYAFISMSDPPQLAAQQLQLERKAGVNGVGFWKNGIAGSPYTVETVADVPTFSQAVDRAADYRLLPNAGPQAIYYAGIYHGLVIVLDVTATPEPVATGLGGLYGSSQAIVKATWKLIAV